MADIVDKQTRSKMMSAVRAKNTKLEVAVRRRLFAQGFRYRLHAKGLPGTPDILFPKYSAAIFVNGCFWHFHGCSRSTIPKTRNEWWRKKLEDNRNRDKNNLQELLKYGWRIGVVWECAVRLPGIDKEKALDKVTSLLAEFLNSKRKTIDISGPMSNSIIGEQVGI